MGLSLNPLRAVVGLFRGSGAKAAVKAVDEVAVATARRAELLAKGQIIAAKAEARLQQQASFDTAMGAKTTAIKSALADMGFGGVRVTSKGGKTTFSMPAPVVTSSKYAAMEKDFLSLQDAFGLTTKRIRNKGKTRFHLSFSDPAMPGAWRPPSAGKPRIRAQAPIIGATANSAMAATERAQARSTRRIKGKNWADTAGVWIASKVYRGGQRLRQTSWNETGRAMVSAARTMRRHPRLTAGYAAYAGYSLVASGDQPFAIG